MGIDSLELEENYSQVKKKPKNKLTFTVLTIGP